MSIGWIAEDVAELTGSAIGTWDFPVTVRKSMDNYRSYAGTGSNECAYAISHKHQTHLHVISQRDLETAQHRSKNELREFLIECSHRLADCCGCERLLLKMSVNLCLTSKSVLSVVDDLLSYFHSRRESLHNLQAELSNALASQTDDSYEPQLSDIEETLTALILHSLVKLVATGTSSDEPFGALRMI